MVDDARTMGWLVFRKGPLNDLPPSYATKKLPRLKANLGRLRECVAEMGA